MFEGASGVGFAVLPLGDGWIGILAFFLVFLYILLFHTVPAFRTRSRRRSIATTLLLVGLFVPVVYNLAGPRFTPLNRLYALGAELFVMMSVFAFWVSTRMRRR